MIEVTIAQLGLDRTTNSPVVILKEKDGTRQLPIWIGPAEASAISLSSPGPLVSPKDLGMSQDSRYLGLSFSQVRVEQAP